LISSTLSFTILFFVSASTVTSLIDFYNSSLILCKPSSPTFFSSPFYFSEIALRSINLLLIY